MTEQTALAPAQVPGSTPVVNEAEIENDIS